jgi:hypothetical protein
MDCFASLAMTARYRRRNTLPPSRDAMRPGLAKKLSPKTEGAGNAGCALHPRSRAQKEVGVHARAYRLSEGTRHPLRDGFTAYAVLPGDELVLSPSSADLRLPNPVRSELATADLAPATGVRTTRFCRTQQRRSSGAPAHRSRGSTRPATSMARRRSRVHHIPPRVRDDARPPLLPERGGVGVTDVLIGPRNELFFEEDWTTQINLNSLGKLSFA